MKLKVLFIGLLIIAVSAVMFRPKPFEKVLQRIDNPSLKSKLIAFQEQGIEKEVVDYDIEKVIQYAYYFLGTRHRMGGIDTNGIDCSGLVYMTHARYGVLLAHSSQEQARYGKVIPSFEELERGDLVFYYNSYKTANFITHTGIYLGKGKFIHTSNNKGVVISEVNDKYYWGERFLFGTRLNKP